MIKSMTGYGREQAVINSREILVEIRSVNHRFYELSARIPRAYGYLEDKIKTLLQGQISRGKIEFSVSINNLDNKDALIKINDSIANGYISALRNANAELNLNDDITLSSLTRFPDIFTVQKINDDEDEIWECVKSVAQPALEKFISMREREGNRLKLDISDKLTSISDMISVIEKASPILTDNYRSRLYSKLCDVLGDSNIDEQRILTEAAIFAEKTSVDEETVRLRSHVDQFYDLLDSNAQIGRKLDFLIQEMNREVNTIGSKIQDIEITKVVVSLKSELEKIREQIQNIE